MKDKEEVKEPLPPRLSYLRLRKGAKDKKEGFVESKGAVAVKDGGIGGMEGGMDGGMDRKQRSRCLAGFVENKEAVADPLRMNGGMEGWMDKEKVKENEG